MDTTTLYKKYVTLSQKLENTKKKLYSDYEPVSRDILMYKINYINTYFYILPTDILKLIDIFTERYVLIQRCDNEWRMFCECNLEMFHVDINIIVGKGIQITHFGSNYCMYGLIVDSTPDEIIEGTEFAIYRTLD
jgi:hypothetical protein